MNTETLINILAITSFVVAFIPSLFNLLVIVIWLFNPTHKLMGNYFTVAFWLALLVWPIVYACLK